MVRRRTRSAACHGDDPETVACTPQMEDTHDQSTPKRILIRAYPQKSGQNLSQGPIIHRPHPYPTARAFGISVAHTRASPSVGGRSLPRPEHDKHARPEGSDLASVSSQWLKALDRSGDELKPSIKSFLFPPLIDPHSYTLRHRGPTGREMRGQLAHEGSTGRRSAGQLAHEGSTGREMVGGQLVERGPTGREWLGANWLTRGQLVDKVRANWSTAHFHQGLIGANWLTAGQLVDEL
nr:hypothetical protein CFP56_79267 [Quercus suber]